MGGVPINTIVELYDEEQMYNVLLCVMERPQTVVFVGNNRIKKKREQLERFFKHMGMDIEVYFYTTDITDCADIIDTYKKILEKFPDCIIDVSGGHDLPLVTAGLFCKEYNVPMYWFDKRKNCAFRIFGEGGKDIIPCNVLFSPSDFLTLAGGSLLRRGHYFTDEFNPDMFDQILAVWEIYFTHQREWARNALYFQQVSKINPDEKAGVNAPYELRMDAQKKACCNPEILKMIQETGMIRDLSLGGSRVRFSYQSPMVKRWLNDVGIWLEMFTYITAYRTGYFDDAQVSVVVDWDGREDEDINTINEIDVILTKGLLPVFVSCKVGIPSSTAINEILVLAGKFGGEWAKAVLVTVSRFSQESPSLYQRAKDLGVYVIEYDDIASGKLGKRLISIAENRGCWKQIG